MSATTVFGSTKPRVILNQLPQGRHDKGTQVTTTDNQQQMPLEYPIRDLEPLQVLNAYRRQLGLGPSKNLISSAICNYGPAEIAECYERTMAGDFSAFPPFYAPTSSQQSYGSSSFAGDFDKPVDEGNGDDMGDHEWAMSKYVASEESNSLDEDNSDTRPSTSQQPSDLASLGLDPSQEKATDQ
ncbi:hypothetical protein F4808DRAFT_462130 [Astrocystis sublimbata]|nr:hypothetical protein F4808DRAFT_462130 [Astrocystis sublimbata]